MRTLIFAELLAVMSTGLIACGGAAKISPGGKGAARSSVNMASATFADTSAWISSDSSKNDASSTQLEIIGVTRISFETNVAISEDPIRKPKGGPKVKVEIFGPKGDLQETRAQEGNKLLWEFDLKAGDGEYELRGQIDDGGAKPKNWTKRFRLDTSGPVIRMASQLQGTENHVGRKVRLQSFAADATSVSCKGTLEPGLAVGAAAVPFDLTEGVLESTGDATSAQAFEKPYYAKDVAVPDDYPNSLLVKVSCKDTFGHESEYVDVTSFEQPSFGLTASLAGSPLALYEERANPNATKYHFLRTGTVPGSISTLLRLELGLLDKKTVAPAPAAVVAREKARLQVFVSNFEIKTLSETEPSATGDRKIYLRKAFQETLEGALPSALLGAQKIWVTLTQIRENDGTEVLLGSLPLDVYIEENGAGLSATWAVESQFVPAVRNAKIPLKAVVRPADGKGAPLAETPKAEYTLNNETWTALPVENWQLVSGDTYSFQISYPLDQEKPFRVRIKATDAAGNETASHYSPNLVAPAGFSVASGTPCAGSGFVPKLASSFLCRKELSGYGTRYFFLIQAQNAGNTPFSFAANTNALCGSQYCADLKVTRGSQTVQERFAADALRAATFKDFANLTLHYGALQKDEIAGLTTLSVEFQLNGSTCAATPLPSLVLKSAQIQPAESPFECD